MAEARGSAITADDWGGTSHPPGSPRAFAYALRDARTSIDGFGQLLAERTATAEQVAADRVEIGRATYRMARFALAAVDAGLIAPSDAARCIAPDDDADFRRVADALWDMGCDGCEFCVRQSADGSRHAAMFASLPPDARPARPGPPDPADSLMRPLWRGDDRGRHVEGSRSTFLREINNFRGAVNGYSELLADPSSDEATRASDRRELRTATFWLARYVLAAVDAGYLDDEDAASCLSPDDEACRRVLRSLFEAAFDCARCVSHRETGREQGGDAGPGDGHG